jgi:hypothetical protein
VGRRDGMGWGSKGKWVEGMGWRSKGKWVEGMGWGWGVRENGWKGRDGVGE